MSENNNEILQPKGELTLQRPALGEATNMFGDVYGGWVSSQIILASEMRSAEIAQGRIATVSVGSLQFMSPVLTGTVLSFYTQVTEVGASSVKVQVEVWGRCPDGSELRKVTETECVQVSIDHKGHIRRLPKKES